MRWNSGTWISGRTRVMRVSVRRGGSANSARGCNGTRGHLAIFGLRHGADLLRRDVARDDQGGIVGRVMMLVEILGRHLVDVAHFLGPAQHRAAIRMRQMQSGFHLLAQQRLRIVFHPHAALFQHHVALGGDVVVGQIQIGHAIGLQIHRQFQPVRRDLLIEGGIVMGGEGVILAAILGDGLGIEIARHLLGAAEHHVFEEMGNARDARRIVHRAHLEPQHLGDDRGAVIRDHQHLHAVGQRELKGLGRRGLRRRRRRDRRAPPPAGEQEALA